jgi:DHA1 family multidrug resistance protein-like MFS transporter
MFRGTRALTVSMFLGSFSWGFAFISLPFYVQAISTADPAATLRWTGWIMGISSLVTVLTGPAWGRVGARGDPRRYYVLIQLFQGLGFVAMAAAHTVGQLFVARFVLGFMGAASTLAFILVGREPEPEAVRRGVAAVQLAMTVGQVLGPLGGALAATRVGFQGSFVVGGVILLGSAAFVHWGVRLPPGFERPRAVASRGRPAELVPAVLLVLAVSNQLFFLPSVLPQVLPGLGVSAGRVVEVGGLVIFASAAAAGLGALLTPRLAALFPERTLMAVLLVASGLLMAAMALPREALGYTVVRFLQVLCAAPIFPLVVARTAQHGSGGAIGVINSARIGGSFVGPVLATSILSVSSPAVLYVVLGLAGMACVPLARRRDGRVRSPGEGPP